MQDNKKILTISDQEKWRNIDHYHNDINIYVYDIDNLVQTTRITIKNEFPDESSSSCALSLGRIGKHFVCAKYDYCTCLVTFIWINLENWIVEETTTFEIVDIVGIRLIGIHDYLSAMVVTDRKIGDMWRNRSAAVYYF